MKERIKTKAKKFIKEQPRTASGIGFAVLLALGVLIYLFFVSAVLPPYDFYTVVKTDVTETVVAQGTVKPASSVDLAFPKSAVISGVYVKEGDVVTRGTVLSTLANSDLRASLSQVQASYDAEKAKLDAMESGDRPEDLAMKQTSVATAKNVLIDRIHNAYTVSDDAVHNQTMLLFLNPRSANPSLTFSFPDMALKIAIEGNKKDLELSLTSWKDSLSGIDAGGNPISGGYADVATKNLRAVSSHLDSLATALAEATPDSATTASILAQYRSSVSLARANVNAAASSLVLAIQSESNAESALTLASAGSTPGDLEAERARVNQALAVVQSVEVSIGQTALVSPIDGIITRVDAKVGAVASANVPLVSVISQGKYQVDTFVSQIDIGKLSVGQNANITLDSEGSSVIFPASVVYVGSGNTPVAGAASYKVTLEFTNTDARVKQGMNANIVIPTKSKISVLAVPRGAILSSNGENYVQIKNGQALLKQKIKTGIIGDTGLVEVLSGVAVGDQVANFGGSFNK